MLPVGTFTGNAATTMSCKESAVSALLQIEIRGETYVSGLLRGDCVAGGDAEKEKLRSRCQAWGSGKRCGVAAKFLGRVQMAADLPLALCRILLHNP